MKSFIVYIFLTSVFLFAASTTTKIKNSEKDLSVTTSEQKKASRRLGKLAKDIKLAEKDMIYLEKKIAELGKNQDKTEQRYEELKIELVKS